MSSFEYTPDDLSVHSEGAIRLMIAPIQSHENGLPEWAKNSADAYVRSEAVPERRIIVLIFDYRERSRPPSIACLDFVGMTSHHIERYFRSWADPDAARADTTIGDLQGGHGNGGKAYMVQMFQDYSLLHTAKGSSACRYGVPGGRLQFGYVPDPRSGRDFPIRSLREELDRALADVGLNYDSLPVVAKRSLDGGDGFTLFRGVTPRHYGRSIPVRQLLERIMNHHQMVRTLQLCQVYAVVNGRPYNGGQPLTLPLIPPLEGAEAAHEIRIPETLHDPVSETEVSTTENGQHPFGKLILRTSSTDMRWPPRRYRHNIQFKARSGFIGIIEMTDLIQSYYGNRIYGECELGALERYKTNDRTRLAESPLTRALKEWLKQQVEQYARQFEIRDRRRYSQEEANYLSVMNTALDQWKNQFLENLLSSLAGGGDTGVPPPLPPLPVGVAARLELSLTHQSAGIGVSFRPVLKFLDASSRRIRPVAFRWVSTDTNVAMVDEDLMVINTFSFGTTTLYAETLDGHLRSNEVSLEVVHIYDVVIQPEEVEVRVGGRQQLQAVCRLADGRTSNDIYLVWTENNPSIARVSAAGMVFGHEPGQTTVTAGDDHCLSRHPARITVVLPPAGGGGTSRGRGFPRILISEINPDPETGESVEFKREDPPVWQRPLDVDRNIWWINSASPLARMYLDQARGYGYNSREWRIYHLERIIEVMAKIAVVYAGYQGEETSAEGWIQRWDDMAAQMQAHATATLGDFIDGGTLPTGR